MGKINSSMMLLLGSFLFMTLVLKVSKWKLPPPLGGIMVVCYFIWAGDQVGTPPPERTGLCHDII